MTTFSVSALIARVGADKFLKRGLELAKLASLPVTSWRVGDLTLSDYTFIADVLGKIEDILISNAKSAFVSEAEGDWKKLHAQDNFGVTVPDATYAQPTITLKNNGVNYYPFASGDLTVKSMTANKTFRNVGVGYDPDTLAPAELDPGATVRYDLIADEVGSDSSVGENELDAIVTISDPDVVILSSAAGAGNDGPDDAGIELLIEDSIGALSPDGAPEAYAYIARTAKYTGTTEISHASASLESETGHVVVTVASPSGPVTPSSVALAQRAVEKWANPICGIPTVQSAVAFAVNFTAVLNGDLPTDYAVRARGAVSRLLKSMGTGVVIARSKLDAVVHAELPGLTAMVITTPATDLTLTASQKPVIGTTNITRA